MKVEGEFAVKQKVGLVAGWGRFPIVVAEALKKTGHEVVCCGIKGHADTRLIEICDHFKWFGMGKLGGQLKFFQTHDVRQATMAGKIFKTLLFQKFHLLRHMPDWHGMKQFWPVYVSKTKDRKDDTLLQIVTDSFNFGGVNMAPATDYAPELLASEGVLTRQKPSSNQLRDIQFAWNLAKEMGRLDVGQSVAVKGRAVLAIEAVEGTDECIGRAGSLCSGGDFVVAKVAKPQQDMRYDVPTVGVSTIETMKRAGASVLCIEADRTIVLDEPEFLAAANDAKMVVVAYSPDSIQQAAA